MKRQRIISTISGGKASAWCANWALQNYPKKDVVLYFNDTKWEHPDLYRFLKDLELYFDHPITFDSDGRSPAQLFYDQHALANNIMPFCSRILKAQRLQKFYRDGDVLVFGLGPKELRRANRIVATYAEVAQRKKKWPKLTFPLIRESVTPRQIDTWLKGTGIAPPALYKMGFLHNNCSGGCVRMSKKYWKLLLEKLPEVYAEREKLEEAFRVHSGRDVHFLGDETLASLRGKIERKEVPSWNDDHPFQHDTLGLFKYLEEEEEEGEVVECIGACSSEA